MALTPRPEAAPRCALCHDAATEGPLLCPGCGTLVHAECRVGVPCPTLGCRHGRPRLARVPAPGEGAPRRWAIGREALLVVACALVGLGSFLVSAGLDQLVPADRRESRVQADQRAILDAAAIFRFERRRRPVTIDELVGPYLDALPRDPWGRPYVLDGAAVLCTGPDGVRGGGDDSCMLR